MSEPGNLSDEPILDSKVKCNIGEPSQDEIEGMIMLKLSPVMFRILYGVRVERLAFVILLFSDRYSYLSRN